MATKIYNTNDFASHNNDDSLQKLPTQVFGSKGTSGEMTNEEKNYLNKIAGIELSALTPVRTPICIVLDLSGSMEDVFENVKFLFSCLANEFTRVQKSARRYTLIIMVIHNGKSRLAYIGDLNDFNCSRFISELPEPSGRTPLAQCFSMADDIITRLYDTLEAHKHWYTIPVFITITDTYQTDSEDDCTEAVKRYSQDAIDGKKLVIEFAAAQNPDGLNMNGYVVCIDKKNQKDQDKMTKEIVKALRVATSTDVTKEAKPSGKPKKADREAFNDYYSDLMIYNFRVCYANINK